MLARMFGTPATVCATVSPTFSRSVSGAYYFAPSLDVLNELAGPDVDR
jgi:deferrochelatase/peroxidase EfeB